MRIAAVLLIILTSFSSFANYQVCPDKKQNFFSKKIDEAQLLSDLRACFVNPYVSMGNPVKYKSGKCIFDDKGQRYLLISVIGDYDHVRKQFEKEVNDDLWLYSLKIERRRARSIPLPL